MASACSAARSEDVEPVGTTAPPAGAPTTTAAVDPTTTTTTGEGSPTTTAPITTTTVGAPVPGPRYVVPDGEVEIEAKQFAADIAYDLTTYDVSDSELMRLYDVAGRKGLGGLIETSKPLNNLGKWSRGEVLYPQLGGLTDRRASVMVVTRQTVGSGPEPELSVVRTLDIRLVRGESGWEFEALASAGGAFDSLEDLALAHAVAADPRIEMPDSARLDILEGGISPILLQVMSRIADITPYGVTVMATGHPYHVFETNRVSHHTSGRAIDINLVGGKHVIDDRAARSATRTLLQWLWENSDVIQVGSPWDVDGGSKRSFTNTVHQDHIHVAVIGPNDPRWVPAIGDRVWEDLDADGIQDAGEPGIGGVDVRLYDGGGNRLASTVTDANGRYQFRELSYGQYRVEIDVPAGYEASPRDRGSDDTADSDIDAEGVMATTTLDPREDDRSRDAGLYRRASMGDLVWEDLDADGIQDPGEPGLADVTVRLFDSAGAQVSSTVTDGRGEFAFTGLKPGRYHLEIDIPAGYSASPRGRGSDEESDSDIDDEGVMEVTALGSHESDPGWDAGIHRSASIGDRVWEDVDSDGIQDGGEPGIGGVTVHLYDAGGNRVRSTTTGADGRYLFGGLAAGEYSVAIVMPGGYEKAPRNRGSDDGADSDINGSGRMPATTLVPGEDDHRWDAGLYQPVP
jgi:hypothetical protein